MEKETLEEIYTVIIERLRDIFENKANDSEKSKNSYIVNADIKFFNRIFKRYTGKAPGAYRNEPNKP